MEIKTLGLLVVGFIGGIIAIPYLTQRFSSKRGGKSFTDRPQRYNPNPSRQASQRRSVPPLQGGQAAKPQNAHDPAMMQELEHAIQRFRHDALAYFIYEESLEQNLSIDKKDMLSKQYGNYGTSPQILAHVPKGSKLLESASGRAAVAACWLKQKGIDVPASQWETALEKYLLSEAKDEAQKIVAGIK